MATSSIPKSSGVYIIRCLANDKIYIGSTKNLRRRWYLHRWQLDRSKHDNPHLQRAWNKYGAAAFVFEVLELVMPRLLLEREQHWLDEFKPYRPEIGFNIGIRANSGAAGREPSEETRRKISAANSGKVRSLETRAKIGTAHKGTKLSKEHIEKLRLSHKGYKLTDETRAKLSVAHRGKRRSPESVEQGAEKHRKTYIVTSPDGTEYTIKGLAKFCREKGLIAASMCMVAGGRQKQHKGWKCRHI